MIKTHAQLMTMLVLLILALPLKGQEEQAPRSARTASYDIIVEYKPKAQKLEGDMRLYWTNTSNDTINNLRFHTYMNAFKNNKTTLMKELEVAGRHRVRETESGRIEIKSMKTGAGMNLTHRMQYVQPDDDNEHDETVVDVALRKPVLPGETKTLKISFATKMPGISMRTGFSRGFLMAAQWYPKIGVYETNNTARRSGQWNCHQFHATTEFYADFGAYNVEIVVPKSYTVGASGALVDKNETTGGKIRHVYKARDVTDFAWSASKRFVLVEDSWKDVAIKLYIQPEHKRQADRYLESLKTTMDYLAEMIAPYPHEQITLIDPPYHAMAASGMEYPTLITTGTTAGLPKKFRFPEMITIHEFIHQYFMGILASNEAEEPWLDEGLTSYLEARIMDDTYGQDNSLFEFFGMHAGDFEMKRHRLYSSNHHKMAPVLTKPWEMPAGSYNTLAYNKPAIWLKTLENMAGRETMNKILKRYYQRWSFKHPKTKDFINVANAVIQEDHKSSMGRDMDWFFNQMLHETVSCDYAVSDIRINKVNNNFEMPSFDDVKDMVRGKKGNNQAKEETIYRSEVVLQRLENARVPVEVKVYFADGFEKITRWDGKERQKVLTFERPAKMITAELDPHNKLLIDKNINNNSYTRDTKTLPLWKYMQQFLFVVQNLAQMFGIFA